VDYLRDLAKHDYDACGGPGVGASSCFCVSLRIKAAVRHLREVRLGGNHPR
jgi:hypothetical protein